jgi:hypothetical protein
VLCALRIPSSSLETVSVTISERSVTQFSLTFSESTGAVRAEDSSVISGNSLREDF